MVYIEYVRFRIERFSLIFQTLLISYKSKKGRARLTGISVKLDNVFLGIQFYFPFFIVLLSFDTFIVIHLSGVKYNIMIFDWKESCHRLYMIYTLR